MFDEQFYAELAAILLADDDEAVDDGKSQKVTSARDTDDDGIEAA